MVTSEKAADQTAAFLKTSASKPLAISYDLRALERALERALLRALERALLRALERALLRALERPSLLDAEGATGVLATMAFLVVFKMLISDFF
jgi:hypothetical protein